MRLIDADILLGYVNKYDRGQPVGKALRAMLEKSPTVDAVPVIRCKDCKHSEPWYSDKRRCFLWHEDGIDVFEDGFCNYAERRTDETD